MEPDGDRAAFDWSWTSGSSASFAPSPGRGDGRSLGGEVALALAAARRIATVVAPAGIDPQPAALATTYLHALERERPEWASGVVRARERRARVECEVILLALDRCELARVTVTFRRAAASSAAVGGS